MIKKLTFSELDINKYQSCLKTSAQYSFYAELYFLEKSDCTWEFLVKDDYFAIMPIPIQKKWGFKVVIHPKLCQQLGVFSESDDPQLNDEFYNYLIDNYQILYYAFNQTNQFDVAKNGLEKRKNYMLLPNAYSDIFKNYSPKRKRKLRLNTEYIGRTHMEISHKKEDIKQFIVKHQIGYHKAKDIELHFDLLWKFYQDDRLDFYTYTLDNQMISLLCIYKTSKSVALFGIFNHPDFLKVNASSQLLDTAIKAHIEDRIFDFEGSNIPSVEAFFSGFRPKLYEYYSLKNSKLKIILSKLGIS